MQFFDAVTSKITPTPATDADLLIFDDALERLEEQIQSLQVLSAGVMPQ